MNSRLWTFDDIKDATARFEAYRASDNPIRHVANRVSTLCIIQQKQQRTDTQNAVHLKYLLPVII